MKPQIEIRYLSLSEIKVEKRVDDKGAELPPLISGYAAVFNIKSNDLGGFREYIAPGAFTRSIREGADVRALIDHNPTLILGRNTAGTLRLKPNQKGLMVEIDPPDTGPGRDILKSLARGDVDGMSFAFRTITDQWGLEDGMPTRTLLDVDLHDVSVVTYPAYPQTEVAIRSLSTWQAAYDSELSNTLRRKLRQAAC